MGDKTGIEWCDSTWNPIRGCARVSEGCRNCYAESMAARFSGPGMAYEGLAVMQHGKPHWTGKIEFVEKHLLDPLKWGPIVEHGESCMERDMRARRTCGCPTRSRRIFVNSMSDLFHENVTDEMRDKIFAVMALCPQHTFQILTKRPQRMLEYLADDLREMSRREAEDLLFGSLTSGHGTMGHSWPYPNVWLGVSVEDQKTADERIPLLLQTPAAVRFLSCEPLLGPVRLDECAPYVLNGDESNPGVMNAFNTLCFHPLTCMVAPELEGTSDGIGWVICGGESGHNARPMQGSWARILRDQCVAAGVPYFFKQWGEWIPTEDPKVAQQRGIPLDQCMSHVGKKAAGSKLDGVEWKQFPKGAV